MKKTKEYSIKDYDEILNEIISYIKKNKIKFSVSNQDGRINSINNEEQVINLIINMQHKLPSLVNRNLKIINQQKPRWWYDIIIKNDDNSFYCPINIKISDFDKKSADNISSKEGLYFSLTGIVNDKCPVTWNEYFSLLSKNIKENSTDYYFIVFNKVDGDVFYTSMRRLKSLTSNGNNLPFQCKWYENKIMIERTFEQATIFLLNTLLDSVKKRAQILDEFNDAFNYYKDEVNKIK